MVSNFVNNELSFTCLISLPFFQHKTETWSKTAQWLQPAEPLLRSSNVVDYCHGHPRTAIPMTSFSTPCLLSMPLLMLFFRGLNLGVKKHTSNRTSNTSRTHANLPAINHVHLFESTWHRSPSLEKIFGR